MQLPKDVNAEQAVIGACFLKPSGVIPKVLGVLDPEDFSVSAHRHIFSAIRELKKDTNFVSVKDWLTKHDLFEKTGGTKYLAEFADAATTTAGVEHWMNIIKDLSRRRKLIIACGEQVKELSNRGSDYNATVHKLKEAIRTTENGATAYIPPSKLIDKVYKELEDRAESKRPPGILTGFENLDENIGGLLPKETSYIAARPSTGKSALCLAISENIASQGHTVFYFSLESSKEKLTNRRLANLSGVSYSRILSGKIWPDEWEVLINAANTISARNLILFDLSKYKYLEYLSAVSESIALDSPPTVIVIDHIQLMHTKKQTQSRHHELSYISGELLNLAKDLNCHVIVASQVRREMHSKIPKLDALKESGDLEQNADNVFGLFRERESEIMQVECLKGRDIKVFKTYLKFKTAIQRFEDFHGEPEDQEITRKDWDL